MMIDIVDSRGPALVLRARGRINVLTADVFEANALGVIAAANRDVVIDASGVVYLSTAGLRVFLLLSRELKDKGRNLYICGLLPHIYQVFEIIGFHRVIPIHPDVASALAVIEGQPQGR